MCRAFRFEANRENALRPTRGDVRHAVELALRTWPEKTQQAIADQVGCHLSYVARIKGEFSTSRKLDAPATVTGKDGKVYPTTKPRKEIWEAMRPTGGNSVSTSLSDGRASGPQHQREFAGETAAAAGMTKQSINQHLARAEAPGEDLDEIAGTSLDKGVELDALKDLPQEERRELIQRAKAGETVSAPAIGVPEDAQGDGRLQPDHAG